MSNVEAVKRYQEKRDSIMLRPSKEDGKAIREAAAAAGKSVQAYVLQAVWEKMERQAAGESAQGGVVMGFSPPVQKENSGSRFTSLPPDK